MRVSVDISYFACCWVAHRQSRLANVLDVLGYALATICRDLDYFTRPGVPCRVPVCLTEADSFASSAPGAWSLRRGSLRPVPFPSRGPAAHSSGLWGEGQQRRDGL